MDLLQNLFCVRCVYLLYKQNLLILQGLYYHSLTDKEDGWRNSFALCAADLLKPRTCRTNQSVLVTFFTNLSQSSWWIIPKHCVLIEVEMCQETQDSWLLLVFVQFFWIVCIIFYARVCAFSLHHSYCLLARLNSIGEQSKTRGVSHCGLAIYIEMYLHAKERISETQIFHQAKI